MAETGDAEERWAKMICRIALLSLLVGSCAAVQSSAQEILDNRLVALRVYGNTQGGVPVCTPGGSPVTLEFDSRDPAPEQFSLKIVHCDRNWNATTSGLINVAGMNASREPIPYKAAPFDVRGYRFTHSARIPGIAGIESISLSGNYLVEIWKAGGDTLAGRCRLFVSESTVKTRLSAVNRRLPGATYPDNQVCRIAVNVALKGADSVGKESLYSMFMKTVDLYRNREIYNAVRIDADDLQSNTFVDGFGTATMVFTVNDIPCGNEYRRLDLRDIDFYRSDRLNRNRTGGDLPQTLHRNAKDAHGRSTITAGDRYSDLLPFQFELRWDAPDISPLYVVGDFNGWRIDEHWKLSFEASNRTYTVAHELRRGVYDYQYVSRSQDPQKVEGSDWQTISVFTAFVYYRDPRFGGFDRIVGFSQGLTPGGTEAGN